MEKWYQKTACVAGANSGMGAALTKWFLESNMKVCAVDKNVDSLRDLKNDCEFGENLTIIQADITKASELSQCMEELAQAGQISVVTYSIGCVGNASLIDGEFSEWQKLVNVNVIGFCSFMKEVVNLMLKQKVEDSRIIILNSIVVLDTTVFSELHFYSATKCAIDALSQGLQYEIQEQKGSIKISNIYAGLVKTDMYTNSLGPNFDSTFFKTLVSLSVDDINESVEYILRAPANVKISRMVVCPRGVFKQNFFST